MTIEDQIKAIEDEIQKTPYNKNTQHHIGKLKAKMARLKEEVVLRQMKSGGGGPGYAVKKSGHATVGLVGFPSVGKSTLLNQITDAVSEVAAYAFTTVTVIPGVMEYRGAKIQILDMPGLIHGASKGKGRGREVLSVTRSCDLILLMVDVFETNVQVLEEELYLANIRLNQKPADVVISKGNRGGLTINPTVPLKSIDEEMIADICREWGVLNGTVVVREDVTPDRLIDVLAGNRIYIPAFVVLNKIDLVTPDYLKTVEARLKAWKILPISAMNGAGLDAVREEIYNSLRFMRVYLKPQGKEADLREPLIVRDGSTVGEVADSIHRDIRKKFRYANVWGKSAVFPGQKVGVNHALQEGDVLTIVARKQ
ncbi:MAG: GTP-binding protein [Methanobacteriota archaeon]|nr:MAG: GTP-binding protein [Euryarchaeota archaeon]